MKKGLNKEVIAAEAVRLVVESGYESLSVREVAARVCIKPASLYNHVEGIEELELLVGEYAGGLLESSLYKATEGKAWREAVKDGAKAYLTFAKENRELYKALISVPERDRQREREIGKKTFAVFMDILHGCGMNDNNCLHFTRILRAYLHGFVELTESGYLTHGNCPSSESFELGVDEFISVVSKYVSGGEEQ